MKYKFFMIPVVGGEKAEAELDSFCDQHCIAHSEKHFVANGENSFWAICVTWLAQEGALIKQAGTSQKKPRIDYKEVLNDEEFQYFSQLRDLRKAIANEEGTPVYNVFTNEQLALMVQRNITTKTDLLALEGVGKKRADKYSEIFLSLLKKINAKVE